MSLFVQVTTAVFISSGFHSAVVTCTNKDISLPVPDNQPEILATEIVGTCSTMGVAKYRLYPNFVRAKFCTKGHMVT